MLAGLIGSVVASGLLLRGAWDLWAQALALLLLISGLSAWLCARVAAGWLPRPDDRLLSWAVALAAMSALAAWVSPVPAYSRPAWAAAAAGLALFPMLAVLDAEGRARVERFLRATAWALVLLAFYQRVQGDTRPAASFLNQNVFAGAILLLLPVAARTGDWALAAGLLVCLWWTKSVGAWLGLSVALIVHRRAVGAFAFWLGAAACFIGLVAAYAKLQSPETLHRVEWWRAAWLMASRAPWLGLGPGAYAYALPSHAPVRPDLSTLFAHQHILETAAERGWPYALLWLAGLAALLKGAPASLRFGPVAALIHGLGDYALSVPGVFWLFCASTALTAPELGRSVNVPLRWRPALCAVILMAGGSSIIVVRRGWAADRMRARGLVAAREARLDDAASLLAESEALKPHPEAARLRAEIALTRGERAEAASYLRRAIALDPYRASNRNLLEVALSSAAEASGGR